MIVITVIVIRLILLEVNFHMRKPNSLREIFLGLILERLAPKKTKSAATLPGDSTCLHG